MHVLIVEDDLALGRALLSALQAEGITGEWVRRASDARHALDESGGGAGRARVLFCARDSCLADLTPPARVRGPISLGPHDSTVQNALIPVNALPIVS
jgi:hypothetical protein